MPNLHNTLGNEKCVGINIRLGEAKIVERSGDKTSGRLDKPAARQPLAGGYARNERHHRTETATYTIPEGWQHRHIAGIPPGCVGSVLEIENKDLS